jgi:hypothetical protein
VTRFVIVLIAFALPALLFWLYLRLQKRAAETGARDPWPLAVVWLTGAVLAVETLALTAMTPQPLGGVYIPARVENGKVIPPQYEPKPADPVETQK